MVWEALFQGAVDEDQGLVVGGGDGGGHWDVVGFGGERKFGGEDGDENNATVGKHLYYEPKKFYSYPPKKYTNYLV